MATKQELDPPDVKTYVLYHEVQGQTQMLNFGGTERQRSTVTERGKDSGYPKLPAGRGTKVIDYAPFKKYRRFNESTSDRTLNRGGKLTVGVAAQAAQLGGEANMATTDAFNHEAFDTGSATAFYDDLRNAENCVQWHISVNVQKKQGVPPEFRVALLVERPDNHPFYGHFSISAEAGFRMAARQTWDQLRLPADDPIIFDPCMPAQWFGQVLGAEDLVRGQGAPDSG